jgi:hypothetical protein
MVRPGFVENMSLATGAVNPRLARTPVLTAPDPAGICRGFDIS